MSRLVAALCALACLANPVLGQTKAPDPVADLALIREKANGNLYVIGMLQQIAENQNADSNGLQRLTQLMGRGFGPIRDFRLPIAYRDAVNFQKAQVRAQVIGQIVLADFDNDGNITKAELKSMLQFDQNNVAASAFFSSDADNNEILTAAEIREAAALAQNRFGSSPQDAPEYLATAFDFDDDGILTQAEFDRVTAALGL